MKPASIYHPDFLLNSIYPAALQMDLNEFVHFQADSLNERINGIGIDTLKISLCEARHGKVTDHSLAGAVAYGSHNSLLHWKQLREHDDLTPALLQYPGAALFTSSMPVEVWRAHPMYQLHCQIYGVEEVAAIGYRFPLSRKNVLIMMYCWENAQNCPPALSEEMVEYISFPFYLGFLYIVGAICDETLHDWLGRCAKITLPRYKVLRSMAGQGISRASDLAEALGVSVASIRRHTENAHEALLQRQMDVSAYDSGRSDGSDGNANRVIALARHYHFFSYGAGQIRRSLPRRLFPAVQPA